MSALSALKALVAADNCNYEASTMRYEGLFEDARQAIAEGESLTAELLEAMERLFENCAMIHKSWGDGDNSKQADAAIKAAQAAIAKAKGE